MQYSKDCFIDSWLSTTAAAATTASAATAAPKTIRASETVETIKTVKAVETEEEKAAKAAAKTKTDLPGLIIIILALIPWNRLVRMEITNIQHLKISLKIIHVHTSININKLCQQQRAIMKNSRNQSSFL
ncbi:hypothetical protein [Cytobacillus pseudoceanisediminis]